MALYNIASNVKSAQTIANIDTVAGYGGPNALVQPVGPNGNQAVPCQSQAFQAILTGSGAISATFVPCASNDGINWFSLGSNIVLSGSNSVNAGVALANAPYIYFGGYFSAISGTNATGNANMSA